MTSKGSAPKLEKKYYIGQSLPHIWSSVYNYKPNDSDILETRGEVFAVISLSSPKSFSAATAGNLLIDRFHEAYFESKKTSLTEALADAIQAMQDRLSELLRQEEKAAAQGVDLDICSLVIRGDEVFFANFGSNKLYTLLDKNAEEVIDITEALRDPFGKGLIKLGSSFVLKDQRFLLATSEIGEKLSAEDKVLVLTGMDDLRIKNADHKHPEKIAIFLVGVDLVPDEEEVELVVDKDEQMEQFEEEPIQEQETVEEQIKVEENIMTEEQVESEDQEIIDEQQSGIIDEQQPEIIDEQNRRVIQEDIATQDNVGQFSNEDLSEEIVDQLDAQPALVDRLKNFSVQLSSKVKNKINQYRKQRELNKLQSLRAQASGQGEGFSYTERLSEQPEIDQQNSSTIKVIWLKTKHQLIHYKDRILYDLLQVNQGGKYTLQRDSVTFKALIVLCVFVLILISYFSIKSISRSRQRAAEIDRAVDKLNIVTKEIDDLENSPVLNTKSVGDIDQREKLLTEISQVQSKFDNTLSLLPKEDVEKQKTRLTGIRKTVLKQKEPKLSILTDVGNLFEGEIKDAVLIDRNLYILDGKNGKVYRQPVSGGDPETIADGLKNPSAMAADANNELVVYQKSADAALVVINPATKQKRLVAGVTDGNLPQAKDMAVYTTSGGLYTVSAGIPKVFQLNKAGNNYSVPLTRYTRDNLTDIRDIQIIDGRIFLLAGGVGIDRIGLEDERVDAFTDIENAVKQASALGYDGSEYIYVADNKGKRILLFTKQRDVLAISDFVSQASLGNLQEKIIEVTASKDRNLVFVVTSNKVLTFTRSDVI